MTAYYNEIDPYAAQWLRNLIAAGHIPAGDVDTRSIADVQPEDLHGYVQCHFFAGIGGWPFALRLAGWPDDGPVWTGSCPCQPFSRAGNRKGFADERHLWPEFHRLIAERYPPVVFGEQVAGASAWLRVVRSDLEALGYAVGAIPVEAASAGAEHFRDRYWFVADRDYSGLGQAVASGDDPDGAHTGWRQDTSDITKCGSGSVADRDGERLEKPLGQPSDARAQQPAAAGSGVRHVVPDPSLGWGSGWTEDEFRAAGFTTAVAIIDGCQYLECPDGKWRRLPPPRVRWLGHGIPARVAKLRAIGNAIDPRAAAEVISAYLEASADLRQEPVS